jgi:hypothetical protein
MHVVRRQREQRVEKKQVSNHNDNRNQNPSLVKKIQANPNHLRIITVSKSEPLSLIRQTITASFLPEEEKLSLWVV